MYYIRNSATYIYLPTNYEKKQKLQLFYQVPKLYIFMLESLIPLQHLLYIMIQTESQDKFYVYFSICLVFTILSSLKTETIGFQKFKKNCKFREVSLDEFYYHLSTQIWAQIYFILSKQNCEIKSPAENELLDIFMAHCVSPELHPSQRSLDDFILLYVVHSTQYVR